MPTGPRPEDFLGGEALRERLAPYLEGVPEPAASYLPGLVPGLHRTGGVMRTFDYIQEHDDTGWWSPYVWPGADALMSWESVGMVIIGAILVLWWGLDDVAVWNVLMLEGAR